MKSRTPFLRRTPPARPAIVAILLAALAWGCDRSMEPYVADERPEAPDLARIFPEGAERSAETAGEQPPMARGAPPPAAPGPAEDAAPVRGRIELAPELEGRVPSGAILFLIARRPEPGPPLAVQRIPSPSLPLEFSIGPGDRMIQALPFAGPLQLSARLDADGNAMTREPGDLQGSAEGTFDPGDAGALIRIDEVL